MWNYTRIVYINTIKYVPVVFNFVIIQIIPYKIVHTYYFIEEHNKTVKLKLSMSKKESKCTVGQ